MLALRSFALAALLPLAAHAAPIYPDPSQAAADISAALREASATHRRVLVDFGGDWCTDCKVLDAYLKQPENAALVAKHYVVVHVNVGARGIDRNFDVAERYGIPLKKGVPALAVLDGDGKVVYSQRNGEFESMRRMDSKSVNEFLGKWAP
ncbi:MAG TPA: thioredoxin family protein [Usitatibacter sp.]|jgi:thiol:disulfide interchange protein|nr:thioredoxin family protein [Usitatibacter sp.]